MTIQSEVSKAKYIGNGETLSFAVPFRFLKNEDGSSQIDVYVGENSVLLEEKKDYLVNGAGDVSGGEVVFFTAPAEGEVIAIIRNVPATQKTRFIEGEDFPASEYEESLDKQTMLIQSIMEKVSRSIVLMPTSEDDPDKILYETIDSAKNALAASAEAVASAKEANIAAETAIKVSEEAIVEVNTAKDTALGELETQTTQHINQLNTVGETQKSQIEQLAAEKLSDFNNNANEKQESINASAAAAEASATSAAATVEGFDNHVEEATTAFDTNAEEKTQEINSAVENVKNQALAGISSTKETALSELNTAATSKLSEINTAGATQTGLVNTAGTEQVALVASVGEKWSDASRIWATGEDAEVEEIAPNEEEHSSRGYADLSMALANTPEDVPIDASTLLALDVIRGPRGEKGEQGIQGEPGASDYSELSSKPQINSVELVGNKSPADLGLQPAGDYALKSEIPLVPTKVSELENDSGYLTEHQDISGKADKSTTLAGYGIDDAYTKSEVDRLIASTDSGDDIPVTLITDLSSLETNKAYRIISGEDLVVSYPEDVDPEVSNTILIQAQFTADISIDWGDDVYFYYKKIPTIAVGNYDIALVYNANVSKWCVSVVEVGVE